MHKVIIIDDEQNGIDSLKLLIENYAKDIKVVAETTDPARAKALIERFKPEIVFLDINMPNKSGFEVLQELIFKKFHLIITTAHKEYALRAIKNNALDYLLKPIDIDDLNKALYKIREKAIKESADISKIRDVLNDESKKRILIHTKDIVQYLQLEDIIRVEADSNLTIFCLTNGEKIWVSKTLKEFEPMLSEMNNFLRIHHSHIINLKHVVRFFKKDNGYVIMRNGDELPVSRKRKDSFMAWLDAN